MWCETTGSNVSRVKSLRARQWLDIMSALKTDSLWAAFLLLSCIPGNLTQTAFWEHLACWMFNQIYTVAQNSFNMMTKVSKDRKIQQAENKERQVSKRVKIEDVDCCCWLRKLAKIICNSQFPPTVCCHMMCSCVCWTLWSHFSFCRPND